MKKTIFLLILGVLLQACGAFTPPLKKPVIEDKIGQLKKEQLATIAVTAQRRLILFRLTDNKFCAEPPPDSAENISSALAAALDASRGDVGVGGEVRAALATSIRQLFTRTQGLQLFRDGSSTLCQMYLNEMITKEEYVELFKELFKKADEQIKAEIPELHKYKYDQAQNPEVNVSSASSSPSN